MNFFKTLFSKAVPIEQSINVVKYPDKIVVATYHRIRNSYSTRSSEISILDANSSDMEIGKAILEHLSLSRVIEKLSDHDRKKNNENYKKVTGHESMKAQMKDALCVHISREKNLIDFFSTVNGGTVGDGKGFQFTKEKLTIEDSQNYELVGRTLQLALERCK